MKNKPNRYHHYIPQCYLRHFGFAKNSKLNSKDYFIFGYNKHSGKIIPVSVDKVCGEDYFYKLSDLVFGDNYLDSLYLETKYFADNIEKQLSRLLKFLETELLRSASMRTDKFNMPKIGRRIVVKHLAIQYLRHPNMRKYDLDLLNEIDNEIYDFIYRNNLSNTPGAEEVLNDGKYFNDDKVLTHAMLSFMNDEIIEQIVDALSDNIWIYNYSHNGDFFTCDNPIHITPHYKGEVNHTLLGLNQYGAEVSWPINPYFTLSIYDRNYFPQKECNDNSIIYCNEEDINHYNIIRYGCAKDFVFSKSKNFTTAERCFMINNIFNLQ